MTKSDLEQFKRLVMHAILDGKITPTEKDADLNFGPWTRMLFQGSDNKETCMNIPSSYVTSLPWVLDSFNLPLARSMMCFRSPQKHPQNTSIHFHTAGSDGSTFLPVIHPFLGKRFTELRDRAGLANWCAPSTVREGSSCRRPK